LPTSPRYCLDSFVAINKNCPICFGHYRPELRTVITDAKKPFWAGEPPTSALIGVAALALPEWLIEIEAIVVVDA
jgi:enamine deaminase RidA (YjgF/YER057c/UK114 family)